MSGLQVGFSRVNINPALGIPIPGYLNVRLAAGYLDDLEINALAFSTGEAKAVMLSCDHIGIRRVLQRQVIEAISAATGISPESVFIHATHIHTGPSIPGNGATPEDKLPLAEEYFHFFLQRATDAAILALQDLQPARLGYGTGHAPGISFIRRYRMKDGTIQTNPGVNNPNILEPIGQVDDRVQVVRIDREKDSIVVVNMGCHPDVIGGNLLSADWPGFVRRTVEKVLDNTKCVFFNGAQGDVNHINVHPTGGFTNGMCPDNDVAGGYDHARYMGRVVTGGVLQAFDKVQYVDALTLRTRHRTIQIPSNRATAAELVEAHRILDLHRAGRDSELPYKAMMLTTVVAEAGRMVRLENGPDFFDMELSAIALGPVVFIGIPGEPFSGIGRGLQAAQGWEMICPCCCTNGYEGYFPMMNAYEEGGYEARSSRMKAGVAERIITEGTALLNELRP